MYLNLHEYTRTCISFHMHAYIHIYMHLFVARRHMSQPIIYQQKECLYGQLLGKTCMNRYAHKHTTQGDLCARDHPTCMHVNIFVRHRSNIRMHVHTTQISSITHARTYAKHTYMYECTHTCTKAHIHACMHTYMHACTHTCMHAYIHSRRHTNMHACTHTCT